MTATLLLLLSSALAVDFHVDIVEPLPGMLVQHGSAIKLIADVSASAEFPPASVEMCIEVDRQPHGCLLLSHPGQPKISGLGIGRHSIGVSLRHVNGTALLAHPLPVTFFVERYEAVQLAQLGADMHELAILCGTDKGAGEHFFTKHYATYFAPLRLLPLRILEIGVRGGSSLQLWHAYFPNATIVGLDISLKNTNLHGLSNRVTVMECDQSDAGALQRVIDKVGGNFDIVIDDGGHTMQQQQVSLGFLLPHTKPGGMYIIEDLHTSKASFYERKLYNAGEVPSTLDVLFGLLNRDKVPAGSHLMPEQATYAEEHIDSINVHLRRSPEFASPRKAAGSLMAVMGKRLK